MSADPAAAAPDVVLELVGVSRMHAGRPVWEPLDLQLTAGVVAVVTGANGSGKTTLLRLAAGLLQPSTGRRRCPGRALYVRGGGGLRTAQTVHDAVRTTAALAGLGDCLPAALSSTGTTALAHRRVGTLSAGERVRVVLAAAVASRPALLCLDEPTAALDPAGLEVLVRVLSGLRADGCAVIVATHQPQSLLATADAHLRIDAGRVRAA